MLLIGFLWIGVKQQYEGLSDHLKKCQFTTYRVCCPKRSGKDCNCMFCFLNKNVWTKIILFFPQNLDLSKSNQIRTKTTLKIWKIQCQNLIFTVNLTNCNNKILSSKPRDKHARKLGHIRIYNWPNYVIDR